MKPVVAFVLTNVVVVLLLTWLGSSVLPSQVNAAASSQQNVSVMIFAHHDATDVANAINALGRSDVKVTTYNLGATPPAQSGASADTPMAAKAFAFALFVFIMAAITSPFFFIFGIIHWGLGSGK
jgi:hypothetical protein